MQPTENYAVAGKRHNRTDKIDDFPSPPWATRALIEKVLHNVGVPTNEMTCWEPAANRGFMVRPLQEYFGHVIATDRFDYDGRWPLLDFLSVQPDEVPPVDFIVTNPPFSHGEEFILKSLEIAQVGVCMLTRTSFLEGKGRYERLFNQRPPTFICQFVERVPMVKGRCDEKATTATSYSWLIWHVPNPATMPGFLWIPPSRKELERQGDYDPI